MDSSLYSFHCVILTKEIDFSLLQNAQTGSGAHPASHSTHYFLSKVDGALC